MASAHVPLVLDGRLAARCRGRLVLDGGAADWLTRRRGPAIARRGAILIDHHDDASLPTKRADLSRPLRAEAVQELIERGYAYGGRAEAAQKYATLAPLGTRNRRHSTAQGDDYLRPRAASSLESRSSEL